MTEMDKHDGCSHTSLPQPPLANKSEEDLYAMAFAEIQGENRRQGLWAKALSESMGDDKKAQALYIRIRVEQLISEQDEQLRCPYETERAIPVVFKCPSCGHTHQFTKGILSDDAASINHILVRCSECNYVFDWSSVVPKAAYTLINSPPSTKRTRMPSPPPVVSAKAGPTPSASPTPSQKMKGLSIASLVCGIIGSVFSITSIPAVICGHMALHNIRIDPTKYGGKGMAIAGIILGYIAIVLGLILGTMKGILWAQLRQMGY